MESIGRYCEEAILFLEKMTTIPSLSFEETRRAEFIVQYLMERSLEPELVGNNIIVRLPDSSDNRPVLMLNSHIDTIKPSELYTFDPFNPPLENERILGVGSNDAGGSVTSLLHTFLYFAEHKEHLKSLKVEPILVLTAEEERSGPDGMHRISAEMPDLAEMAIVGEPTGMRAAVAERGLLVIDATAKGVSGHAACNDGENAILIALDDISILRNFVFEKISPTMGATRINVTQINAGTAHNVIPDECSFVVDIRPTDAYTNPEIMEILQKKLRSTLKARNLTNRSSATPIGHPLLDAADRCSIEKFISPTTSDWMRLKIPAIKMGPGESSRSHKADEYILKEEICHAIPTYIKFITNLK